MSYNTRYHELGPFSVELFSPEDDPYKHDPAFSIEVATRFSWLCLQLRVGKSWFFFDWRR
jgi:hypothetical protein